MNAKQAQQMVNQALSLYDSKVKAAQANAVDEIRVIDIDLSESKYTRESPLQISFPFKSLRVEQATDLQTYLNMIPESADAGRGGVRLGLLDSFNTEFGMSKCFLHWPAQAGKKMRLIFFTTSTVSNGRQLLDQNSAFSVLKMGDAEVMNDGLSVIHFGYLGTGQQYIGANQSGINNTAFSNGNISFTSGMNGGTATQRALFVPPGYEAEILQLKTQCFVATSWSATPRTLYVTEVEAKNYDDVFAIININNPDVQSIASFPISGAVGTYYYQPKVESSILYNRDNRTKVVIKGGQSGKCLNWHITGSWTTGTIEFSWLVRFSRSVG